MTVPVQRVLDPTPLLPTKTYDEKQLQQFLE